MEKGFWRGLLEEFRNADGIVGDQTIHLLMHESIEDLLCFLQIISGLIDILCGLRIQSFQNRQDIEAQFVTEHIVFKIGRVRHVVLADGMKVFLYFLTTDP